MEIQELKSKKWRELVSFCKDKSTLLALSSENELVDAAKLQESNGATASACYISAVLMAKKSAIMAIDAAAYHFAVLAKKHKMPKEFHERVRILEEQTCWAGMPYRSPCPTDKWEIKPPKRYLEDHGGMLLFLLQEGAKRLSCERTGDLIARQGVREFMDWIDGSGGLSGIKKGVRA